jgi:hypothetical protein
MAAASPFSPPSARVLVMKTRRAPRALRLLDHRRGGRLAVDDALLPEIAMRAGEHDVLTYPASRQARVGRGEPGVLML